MKTWKAYLVLAASAAVLAVATPASAGGVTSPGAVIDTIDWSQLGAEGTFVATPATVTTSLGDVVTVSNAASASLLRVDQSSAWSGNFAPGTTLLWTTPFLGGSDITLTFKNPIYAVGAQIQADDGGPFTAQITVNGTQSFTENGVSNANADNSAIFIGWQGGPINTVEFTLTSAATNLGDFAIGPVLISTPGPVPGAGVAGLAALALAGLYARTRRV